MSWLLSASDEDLTCEISLLKRRRMLHIMEGEHRIGHFFAQAIYLLLLDGFAKGYFGSRSSCTGHPLSGPVDTSRSTLFSLKKKDLFNAKEAHNHSFSHAVCNSLPSLHQFR
jgi:hypothetical protein